MPKPIPEGFHSVTPYLTVPGVSRLVAFVQQAFGAEVVEGPMVAPDGRVMHVEVRIGDSLVMMGEPTDAHEATPATLYLYVPNVDATYGKALEAGAVSIAEPATQFYGDRHGGVKDPSGNRWWIATHVEDVSPEEMQRRMAARAQS